jgi:hypothetical protein
MRVVTILLVLLAGGCALPLDGSCIDERRSLSLEGVLQPAGAAAIGNGTAFLGLIEARNYRTKHTSEENFYWAVRASGFDRSTVSAVHVHERETGRLLFQIPIENTNGPADVITLIFSPRPHNGLVAQWSVVYELLGSGSGYLDVHAGGSSEPVLRANLSPQFANWRDFVHSSCD